MVGNRRPGALPAKPSSFLLFLEKQGLKPGQSIEVEVRDPAADSVQLRTGDERRLTIGTKAASKLLIEVL